MNETASTGTGAADASGAAHDRRLRTAAKVGLALLVPTAVVSVVLSLMTERAADCVMYGNRCSSIPGPMIFGAFLVSAALGAFAVGCPREWLPFASARSWAVKLQGVAQVAMAMLLLVSP
ncbi:hypothetical protein GTZ78_09980 [Streptomyces sp. SID8361]|uniref:hypothetical protein n=1 Tax=Streptomyces sp. MnatMP-M27 TaxID=1839768 RepID=UPI00081E0142|nr:hypothetical protein [Streptomyces sp. MnatMP-M27]MYU11014.1 hypothetical protein [Streptomyces sp. SID8361]SCF77429.1 hypothetical protein GA0115260_102344 [Streptomyces sp. MnatMP-M27]